MATTDTKPASAAARPLSPHLQIYRLSWTMVMSIVHRITGLALVAGTALLAIWLVAAASGEGPFEAVRWAFGTWIGRLVLFGYTWALVHHMLGGLRHFIWDLGKGYDLASRMLLAKATLIGSVGLTLVIWIVALALR